MPVSPAAALARCLGDAFGDAPPRRIGVAVSGGGDSVALLHLAQGWCAGRGVDLLAATIDHGLRPESAAEAAGVARACAALGVAHSTWPWHGWTGQGNLQAAARAARRDLLAQWAARDGLGAVLLGHTADDQAETVLMRLARGSGVDGLCGMAAVDAGGLFVRPLLEVSRGDLRDWLRGQGIGWVDDPSNDDPRFDRIKVRRLLAGLGDLGLTVDRLTETARHMQRARITLRQAAAEWVAGHVQVEAGDVLVDADTLRLGRSDTAARVLAAAVQWIGGSPYRPRLEALQDLARAVCDGEVRTLGGVRVQPGVAGGARLTREPAAAGGAVAVGTGPDAQTLWDGRWVVSRAGPDAGLLDGGLLDGGLLDAGLTGAGLSVGALGETGLAACPDWRGTGLPRPSLLATPAIWHDGRLIAAPLAGFAAGWRAGLRLPFDRFIVSH